MKKLFYTFLILLAIGSYAQKKKKQDIEAIMDMCGCHEVTFNFAETFSPIEGYEFHDNYTSSGLEYVFPVEESDDKIVLQHLLVINDTMIIKHWRQDWLYENTSLYTYHEDNTWKYTELHPKEVKGQWTQKVYQVDDGPRYEGSGSWVHVDGTHYWESFADAPLPRREFSKRSDYNVTARKNRQEILENGWVHEQDNKKIVRKNGEDKLIAEEKGYNPYIRVDMTRCQPAIDWWTETEVFWADVRAVWDELFAKKTPELSFKKKVDDQVMFMKIFALESEMLETENYDSALAKKKLKAIINEYLKGEVELAMAD